MKTDVNEITINGMVYVPQTEAVKQVETVDGLPLVLVRTYSAGVHFGYLKKRESTLAGIEVTLVYAKRIWAWYGAATLSQLAVDGVSRPAECKIPCAVPSIEIIAIEIIPISDKAKKTLDEVPVWKA